MDFLIFPVQYEDQKGSCARELLHVAHQHVRILDLMKYADLEESVSYRPTVMELTVTVRRCCSSQKKNFATVVGKHASQANALEAFAAY